MTLNNTDVAVEFSNIENYPNNHPYNPSEIYPELHDLCIDTDKDNRLYSKIRKLFFDYGMDRENYDKKGWNPFRNFIRPGMTVFIKPNTVSHKHKTGGDIFSIITHASVLRPVIDYVIIALKGVGRIIVGDSPLYDSDYNEAMKISGIKELLEWFKKRTPIQIEYFDLRINKAVRTWLYGKWSREEVGKDPRGYQFVDLKDESYFKDIEPNKLRIAVASHKNMMKYHDREHHKYLFPKSLLESDVIINVPKLKTHRRTGITLALKNFMGLPALKDSLPHFMVGTPDEGGDQYINPSLRKRIGTWMHDRIQTSPFIIEKFIFAVLKYLNWKSGKVFRFKDDISEAMWPGNDTVWRTLLDLNRAALYADKEGCISDKVQRNYLCIMDGIIGGEGNGPLACDPVHSGVLLIGSNPVSMDIVAATLMGFDPDKIRLIRKAIDDKKKKSSLFFGYKNDINVVDNGSVISLEKFADGRNLHYKPHPAWIGFIERSF